ncbi:hypothetical protein GW17_00023884 [Ensete ventricosum]|nr:hypothetical protein GW17_00023884 [Ensete ventricosum]
MFGNKKPSSSSFVQAFTLKLVSLLNVAGYGSVVLFTMLFLRGGRRTNIAGWICASFAFSCFRQVIRTKSVEYMPISLSFFLTVSAIAWLGYGLLLGDLHVALPNVVGFLFGTAQIIIYLIYKNAKKDDTKTKLGNQAAEAMAAAAVIPGSDIELPGKLSTPLDEV